MFRRVQYSTRLLTMRPRRYSHLLKGVYGIRARSILEIGVFDGKHAKQMIETAGIFRPRNEIQYWGFDLFDLLTDADLDNEFSKRAPTLEVVNDDLLGTGAKINLYRGYTRDTVPRFVDEMKGSVRVDFVFIDGGHAVDTIRSDWECIQQLMDQNTTVIFDDYYGNDVPEVAELGCRAIVEELDRNEFDVKVLSPEDSFQKDWGTLGVRMVRVRRRRKF